jgi:hypothetical protein
LRRFIPWENLPDARRLGLQRFSGGQDSPSRALQAYDQPTGGWGSVKSLGQHAIEQRAVTTASGLKKGHDKVGGYGCTSCTRVAGLILVSVACDDGCEVFVESLDA